VCSSLIFIACLLLACLVGARFFFALRGRPILDRWIAGSIPVWLVAFASFVVQAVLDGPYRHWNAIRITPTLGLFAGYTLYYGPGSGPVTGNIYAPFATVAYLPAVCASTPSGIIGVGTLISLAWYFAPVLWLYVRLDDPREDRSTRRAQWHTLALFPLVTYNLEKSLRYSAAFIHADAPALGLACAAGAVLYVDRHHRWRSLLASALLAVLSVWSKQVMAPLLAALPLWVLWTAGWKVGLRYALALVGAGSLVLAVSLAALDGRDLFFNVVTIPGRHPWEGRFPNNLAWVALEFQNQAFLLAILLAFGALYPLALDTGARSPFPQWLDRNRWSLFLLVGLLLLPTSLAGRLKVGGDLNALSFTLYFLLLAVCLMLREGIARPQAGVWVGETRRCGEPSGTASARLAAATSEPIRTGSCLLSVIAVTGSGLLAIQGQCQRYVAISEPRINTPEVVYSYLKNHPGEAYFPWNPMGHVMAEGKYHHFEYGLYDRKIAGFPISEAHFRQGVPAHFRLVCVPKDFVADIALSHATECSRRVEIDELPGFVCFARDTEEDP
jgi:hypothetical protein